MTGYIQTFGGEKLGLGSLSTGGYEVVEIATARTLVGGEKFATRKVAREFAEKALRDGYETYEPRTDMCVDPKPMGLASDAVQKARWEAIQRDRFLMSPEGMNFEE